MATTTYRVSFQHISDKDVDPGQESGRLSVEFEMEANASDEHLNMMIVNAVSAKFQAAVELDDLFNIDVQIVPPFNPQPVWSIDDLPTTAQQNASPWSFDSATVRFYWKDSGERGSVEFLADRRANPEQLRTVADKAIAHEVIYPELIVIESVSFDEE